MNVELRINGYEHPAALRLVADFLTGWADMREGDLRLVQEHADTQVQELPAQPAVIEQTYAEAAAPAPAADEPFEEQISANDNEAVAEVFSQEQVIAALTAFGKSKGAVALKGVLDGVGAKRVSEIAPESYGAVMAALKG